MALRRLLRKYPLLGQVWFDIKRFSTIPIRVLRIPEYLRRYDDAQYCYRVGDVVRVRASKEEKGIIKKIIVPPHLQQHFPVSGPADEYGYREARDTSFTRGTIGHSLFIARDPWVIVSTDLHWSQWSWVWSKVVKKLANRIPGNAILKPLLEERILWPESTPFGRNRIVGQLDLLERVPLTEIKTLCASREPH